MTTMMESRLWTRTLQRCSSTTQLASPPLAKRVPCPSWFAGLRPLLRQARQSGRLALHRALFCRSARQGGAQLRRVKRPLLHRSPPRAATPTSAAPRLRLLCRFVASLASERCVVEEVALPLLPTCEHVAGLCPTPHGAGQEAGQVTHLSGLLRGCVSNVARSTPVERVSLMEGSVLGLHAAVALTAWRLEVDNWDKDAHRDGCTN